MFLSAASCPRKYFYSHPTPSKNETEVCTKQQNKITAKSLQIADKNRQKAGKNNLTFVLLEHLHRTGIRF